MPAFALPVAPAAGQDDSLQTAGEWAWKTITVEGGVRFSYVFYVEADGTDDGVVLRLDNRNRFPVRYRFTAVFRSGDRETERVVSGWIASRSIVTGASSGLYFIPFRDGSPVGEIGLRGITVERER